MDDCRSVGAVEDDQLQELPGSVRAEHEVAEWVVADLFDDYGVLHGMVDVFGAMPWRNADRRISLPISYYEIPTVTRETQSSWLQSASFTK